MSISMEMVKKLREMSGAGMVDCKKALGETGELDLALEALRKKGIAKAAKREDREANEGIIKVAVSTDGKKAFIAEFNAETDFVSRSERFQGFCRDVFGIIQSASPANAEELMQLKMGDGNTVKDNLETLSGVIGEKLGLKNFAILSTAGTAAAYSHMGGRIGVIITLDSAGSSELAYDVAMQIAASNPRYILPGEVDPAELAKEKEIYAEQLRKEGKQEDMISKILEGKVKKYYEEVCLAEQEYIKDDKQKVKDILGGAKVESFARYSL